MVSMEITHHSNKQKELKLNAKITIYKCQQQEDTDVEISGKDFKEATIKLFQWEIMSMLKQVKKYSAEK